MFPTFFSKPCFEFFWGNFLGFILTSWFVSLRNQITLYFNIVEDVEAVTKFATYQGEWHSYYGPCRDLQFEYKRQDKNGMIATYYSKLFINIYFPEERASLPTPRQD